MIKTYKTENLTIIWKPNVCIHSTICFKGLPHVFNPREKPWIKSEKSNTEELMNQIKKCPSGALSYKLNNETLKTNTMETTNTKIQLAPNGPLLVNGTITIIDKDGNETAKEGMTALCRCGHSQNKPFCDGAHKPHNFES